MNAIDLATLSVPEVLVLHGAVLAELRRREVCRTENNPTGDYAEYLAVQRLGIRLNGNSASGCDATDLNGVRYQIKGRRVTRKNGSTQLSVIRNLNEKEFDYLIGLLFNEHYSVLKAAKVPHGIIEEHGRFSEHQNGHIVHMNARLLADPRVEDLTPRFLN